MSYYHDHTSQPSDYVAVRNSSQETFNFEQDLFDQIFSPANVNRAWKQVKTNKGAPGIDNITIEQFPGWANLNWRQYRSALFNGEYQPSPVKRVEIDKPGGGTRQLGIPTVLDRVIQQAITQVLSEIIDPTFSNNSFGFRPRRSAHDAVKQVQGIIKRKRNIAVDVDLSKFFDRVNHDLLMRNLKRHINDKHLLTLIGRYLRAGILDNGKLLKSTEGVPQGGPLSPLLSNIMLDDLDKELEARGHQFARYADDFIILVKSERAGHRVLNSITQYLESRLKLKVNTEKSQVAKAAQSKFLGFTFKYGKIKWHNNTLKLFKDKVRQLTNRNWGVSMAYQLFKISQYLRGWIAYYGIANTYQQCIDLDCWIKRRVRMCYWRQWRKPRTKVRNLMKLGVRVQAAVACGMTSKGPWRSSKTPGIQQALDNKFLKAAGLTSLRDGWVKVHYPNG